MKPRNFYATIWVVLVAATILEVITRSLSMAVSAVILIIVTIACAKAVMIALYYQGLRYEPLSLAALPITAFVIVALLAITTLFMAAMTHMGM
jgi:hypothetical protein